MNLEVKPKPRHWLSRPKWCPDKTCRPMGKVRMYGDADKCGTCMGQLKNPTDHIFVGANDMGLCFKQGGKLDRWHLNYDDVIAALYMVYKTLEARQQPLPGWLLERLRSLQTQG